MSRISHFTRAILAGVSASALLIATPIVAPSISPAAAQARNSISIEFRTALTPYGSWRTSGRWGEVWVPARVARDWQPYTAGNWVYSDDYGWYWISNSDEAEWGWVTYHYGRWAFDDSSGWVWVPDNVWGPAWVDWRRGEEYVGWSPLPPDEVVVEYRENPRFWIFVRAPELISPRLRIVFLPLNQRQTILARTSVVNHTSVSNGRRFAVNPGIAPAVIAAAARQPVRTVAVRPHVVAGTADIRGAVEVSAEDLRRGGNRPGQSIARAPVVQKTVSTVEPAKVVPPSQPLGNNDKGKPGENPPRAAVGEQDRGTTSTAPTNQRTAPIDKRQEGAVPRQQREGAVPVERVAPLDKRQEGVAPRQQREGAVPIERAAPTEKRQESVTPRQQPREGVAPAERGNQTPGTSGQAPARDERRGQVSAPPAQPTPAPLAKAPSMPASSVPSQTSAAPPHQDDKKIEDTKKQ